jgi:hypothetical protein
LIGLDDRRLTTMTAGTGRLAGREDPNRKHHDQQ